MIASTPSPPYFAVIFTSLRTANDNEYNATDKRMLELAAQQQGYLGIESAREETGITVSYWQSEEAIRNWKNNLEHVVAQGQGRNDWYKSYKVRVCKVERDYGFERKD